MKGISGGLNRDVGPSSTPKSGVQRWKPSVGGWTSGRFNPKKLCSEMKGWTGMWGPVQPRKVGFRDESHQWGVEPWVWVQPEKLCSEMKGISGGLNRDVGPSSTPKSGVQRWKPSVGGWTSGLSSTPKSCVQRWKVEPGCGAQFNPEKWGSEMKAISGGLNLGSEFNPKSCAQRWKVSMGGWTGMWVLVQPRKVGFRDESHQWGVEPRVSVQLPKSCVQRWKVLVGGWTGMWVLVQPQKKAKKTLLVRFVLRHRFNSYAGRFLNGSFPVQFLVVLESRFVSIRRLPGFDILHWWPVLIICILVFSLLFGNSRRCHLHVGTDMQVCRMIQIRWWYYLYTSVGPSLSTIRPSLGFVANCIALFLCHHLHRTAFRCKSRSHYFQDM